MKERIERILISEQQIQDKVKELGQRISRDFEGQEVTLIGLLKGSVIFLADLSREVTIPCRIDFMNVTSYGNDTESSGEVRFLKDLDDDIHGKNVVVVEDIIDTGYTLREVLKILKNRNPRSLKLCTLLDKVPRRKVLIEIDYNGFDVPDEFVVGYGLDYAQKYRNLNYIGILRLEE